MSGNSKERARVRKIGAKLLNELGRVLDEGADEIKAGRLTVEELAAHLKEVAVIMRDPVTKEGNRMFGFKKTSKFNLDYLEE